MGRAPRCGRHRVELAAPEMAREAIDRAAIEREFGR